MDSVSVVIVTFNAAATLRSCIESVLGQSYAHKEIVVVDGGSTDDTCAILSSYGSGSIRWQSEADKGIYDAMNKGIRIASGKWILFLGADDYLAENSLASVFSHPACPDSAVLLYGKVRIEPGRRIQGAATDFQGLVGGNIPHQAIFYSRQLLLHQGGYDLHYPILADYDLNLRIFERRGGETFFIDQVIAVFSSRGASNRTLDAAFFTEKLEALRNKHRINARDHRLAHYYFYSGMAHWLKKNYGRGLRNIFHPMFFSDRRLHYALHAAAFFLAQLGIGRKFRMAT